MIKAAGERMAINMPVQGTSADMIKKAMVEIDRELANIVIPAKAGIQKTGSRIKSGMTDSCNLILQIHDELLFECDSKVIKEIGKMVKEKMEEALKLDVPIVVDLKVGPNWGEMEPLIVW